MADTDNNDIAIVGMAIRVPGASTPEQYWANLRNGVESLRTYSDEELKERGISAATLADPHYVKAGMFLQNVDQFDPEFFGFSPKEAAILDPQHRHFYECAWEALERAGHPPSGFEGNIGVFAGCGMGAYFAYNLLTNRDLVESVGLFLLRHTGNDKDFLSTRVSYAFDLKGPSINVQTACSTSLVATHLAVQSLLTRECDMAMAGGVTIELPHAVGYHYKEGEILSPDGHCRTFDHRSKGTVFGSGVGVIVLRRLSDALADGDHIHAVIKGSAVNNDGSAKVGYLAPSVDGQAAAIAEALAIADVAADTVGYVECHGTATPVGDPIEIAALTQAFRESSDRSGFCKVGSVKTNIGHLDTAAGVASLIKTALALENRQIPPSLHFEAPNPTIAFEGSPFTVASRLTEWKSAREPRRAGVNSLGVGGTNAFAVLQEAPVRESSPKDESPQLLVLSARNKRSLDDATGRLASWLRTHPEQSLADVSFTLLKGRHAFEQRRVLAASSHEEAALLLESNDARRVFTHTFEGDRPGVVFMYPGGGAQYVQMGLGLYRKEALFREHLDRGLKLLQARFSVDLAPVFLAEESLDAVATHLARPSVQLPLIFLVEYALTQLWESYGVKPDALIGHSLGENTAACVAGVISFEDALGLVLLRGQLMDEVPEGAMLSVSLPATELLTHLDEGLDLAASNSPLLSVASGPAPLIDALANRLQEQRIDCQRVRINIAAHSRLLEGILGRFRAYLKSIRLTAPCLPIISNRTGTWLEPARAVDPEYWVEHLRNSVRFAEGIATLAENEHRIYIEVGPGNTLGSFARQTPKVPTQRVLPSLRHHQDTVADEVYFRTVIGRAWALGGAVTTEKLWAHAPQRVPLPTYAFQHARYWIDPGAGSAASTEDDTRPARLESIDEWFRQPRWVQQGVVETDGTLRTWLVFANREPVSDALLDALRNGGHKVVTVYPGDTFARTGENTYSLAAEAGGAGYRELVTELETAGLLPDRILHLWLVTWDRTFRPGSSFFHRNQEYGFYSLLHLVQALGKSSASESAIHFTVVTNGMQRVAAEPAPYPDKATVLGPCSVIPREYPHYTCRAVDIELPRSPSKGVKAGADERSGMIDQNLLDDLQAQPVTEVVAWRQGVRWQRHLGAWKHQAAARDSRLKERGVYLITGGLGGIAGVLAEWLARNYRARLVLVARTPLPGRQDWDEWITQNGAEDPQARSIRRIRHLESLGAEILTCAADVTVAERMQEVVEEAQRTFGPINGVFHTAGVIRDNLIQLKNQRDIEEVFAAKLYGTLVLDEIFRQSPLDFMVLFSSTSAFIAPQGQIDYVGANSFLNSFADSCRGERPYPVIALNWGIWQGVGMVGPAVETTSGDALEATVSHGTIVATQYPLFHLRNSSREGHAHVHILGGSLEGSRDWVINEHRLANNRGLLPGTGYVELIRAALAEVDQASWQLSNLVFLNPLFVLDDKTREFRVRLRGDSKQWEVDIFAGNLDAPRPGEWQHCATARVTSGVSAPAVLPVLAIEQRCDASNLAASGSGSLRTRQEAHLKFGPRWGVLKRLNLGNAEALAHLQLPQEFAEEVSLFGLHPGLLDIATGCAMDLIPGYAAQEVPQNLWAPIAYKALRFYAPLSASLVSWIRVSANSSVATGFAAFDIVLADPAGNVLAEIDQLTLRRLDGDLSAALTRNEMPSAREAASAPEKTRTKTLSPGEAALQYNVTQGIDLTSGMQALTQLLSMPTIPSTFIVSSMGIDALRKQADAIVRSSMTTTDTRFTRPQLDNEFEAPRDEIEKGLSELWGKLLGVEGVGIRDSFFDLGGHSLIAVRLFNEVGDRFKVDLPMSVLMQSPTVAGLADLIRSQTGTFLGDPSGDDPPSVKPAALQYQYVVPMHAGPVADGTPIFMVAGMFGNVLNLSHLAHLLGEEHPFYALQARGLYGNTEPHETFDEAARDYLAEVRRVQPNGPYLLGGYSGGGIVAYEMARQLIAQDEQVLQLIFLDTPLARITQLDLRDRITMLHQDYRQERSFSDFIVKRIRARNEWKEELRKREKDRTVENSSSAEFQSRRIGDAFIRAIARYETKPLSVTVSLFRPKLKPRYQLRGNRLIDFKRDEICHDNGWSRFVSKIQITEVPGDHDSMVLEPNVRILTSILRRSLSDG